jgi:hypothetical protein
LILVDKIYGRVIVKRIYRAATFPYFAVYNWRMTRVYSAFYPSRQIKISQISGVDEPASDEPDIHFVPSTPIYTKVLPRLSQTISFSMRGSLTLVFEIDRGIFFKYHTTFYKDL